MEKLKEFAISNNVPIIQDEGLDYLIKLLNENKCETLLEIGSAIGYSALNFSIGAGVDVYTIERDDDYFNIAVKNIQRFDMQHKITIIHSDALTCDYEFPMVDVLYIDAAKAQYKKFLDKYEVFLKPGGLIVFDNLDFHGFVEMEPSEIKNRNTRQLVRKINEFLTYIKTDSKYSFEVAHVGDGIGIARINE
jgi:predicted O-methyltransferase YrrM